MKDDPSDADLLERSREALLESAAQHLQLIHEAKRRRQTPQLAMRGTIRPPDPATVDRLASDFLRELARFSLTSHEAWLKFSKNNFQQIVEALYGSKAGVEAINLDLKAQPGKTATGRFVLVNPSAERATVSFTDPQLVSRDGKRRLENVSFTKLREQPAGGTVVCPELTLAARERSLFQLAVTIPKRNPTVTYCGESTVVVADHVVGRLRITVVVQ